MSLIYVLSSYSLNSPPPGILLYLTSSETEKEVYVHEGGDAPASAALSEGPDYDYDSAAASNGTDYSEDLPSRLAPNSSSSSSAGGGVADLSSLLDKMANFGHDLNARILARTKSSHRQAELVFSLYMLVIVGAMWLVEQTFDRWENRNPSASRPTKLYIHMW